MFQEYIKEKVGDVVVQKVNLSRATLKEAEEFKNTLIENVGVGKKKIVVDLEECEFIDSTFLGVLVVSMKKITALGGEMRLVGLQPQVRSMFELTRMYRVIEVFETKEEAVASFES